jgi:hypothetical protein
METKTTLELEEAANYYARAKNFRLLDSFEQAQYSALLAELGRRKGGR